jgi:hypothetical protein
MKWNNFLTCSFFVHTGIKKSPEEYKIKDKHTDILLCVSSIWDDVKISGLSDEDFDKVWFVNSSSIYACAYRWKNVASANIFCELEAVILSRCCKVVSPTQIQLFSFEYRAG